MLERESFMRVRVDCSIVQRGWKNENCLARFCLFEAVPVDGRGDARVRDPRHADGDRVSGSDETETNRRRQSSQRKRSGGVEQGQRLTKQCNNLGQDVFNKQFG